MSTGNVVTNATLDQDAQAVLAANSLVEQDQGSVATATANLAAAQEQATASVTAAQTALTNAQQQQATDTGTLTKAISQFEADAAALGLNPADHPVVKHAKTTLAMAK
jgi:hypothetical protein